MSGKYERLKATIREMGSAVVAFSAGVDSTFLMKVAHDVLGDGALAVIGRSASIANEEIAEARKLAHDVGIAFFEIDTAEMSDPAYLKNAPDRCFHCKNDLFRRLTLLAKERGFAAVLDGSNADDRGDYRPGMLAARNLGVRSPLQEVDLSKREIRALSKELGLATWDKPAMACLSSRIPYGQSITAEKLGRVNEAERFLKGFGFTQVRVRCHEDTARIEVPLDDLPALLRPEVRDALVRRCKEIGFVFVTLDLQGYRTGSMNEVLGRQSAGVGDGR